MEDNPLPEKWLNVLAELIPDASFDWTWTNSFKKRYDAMLTIRIGISQIPFAVEIKTSGNRIVWGQLMAQLADEQNATLMTDYVNPVLGEKLRSQGINYIDTVGNVYIRVKTNEIPILLWIDGKKPIRQPEERADHAFTKIGLYVTYSLLQKPYLVNETIRTVAQQAGTSLDTVVRAKSSLQQRGFLTQVRAGEWKLTNRRTLLEKWVEAYATRLQPGLLMGRYRLFRPETIGDWQSQQINTPQLQWGGEPAADQLTDYLRPAEWVLYTRQPVYDLIRQLRLLPDATGGPVRIYQKFWPNDEPGNCVSPILVYADLLINGDPRNLEIANQILHSHAPHLLD